MLYFTPNLNHLQYSKFVDIIQKYEWSCTQQRQAKRQAEYLFQSPLDWAFRGRLIVKINC